ATHAHDHIQQATKLTVWRGAVLALLPRSPSVSALFKQREYLRISCARTRKDVARLLSGVSPCAIETLRSRGIPRARRICRFCRAREIVEDEHHILFECHDPALQEARTSFYTTVFAIEPGLLHLRRRCDDWPFFGTALNNARTASAAATLVNTAFTRVRATAPLILDSEEDLLALPGLPR
ncbi:hypothetical protein C8Q73DRAFT_732648, partial [Cubamyces lactineus]